jgi:Mce-associated membrane protein
VEDQSTDPGDLTAAGPVPQGKAGRTRHRLPRAKVHQAGDGATSEEAAGEDTASSETADAEAVEPEPSVEPTPRRRRFPWQRSTPPTAPAPEAAERDATEEPVELENDTSAKESEADAAEPGESADEASEDSEPVLVPHRTAGRRLKVAAIVAGVLFVGATAFAGATLQPYLADRAAAHTKFEIAETAANAITTLWTYTPDDMDSLPDRASKFLTGDFAVEYRRFIDAIMESNKQAQVTNNTQVLGAAVESLTPTEASAIVYTNSVSTSPVTKGIPSMRYLSYRLTMELRNRQWLITKMTAVTSLDLTPKL